MSNVIPLFKKWPFKNINTIQNPPEKSIDDAQLSLPFNDPHTVYIITGEIGDNSKHFCFFSSEKKIAAILDMRLSPRLDFIASSRQKAFALLKEIGVSYFDVLGRLGIDSFSSAIDNQFDILKDVVTTVDGTLKGNESCLMIFDQVLLSSEYSRALRQCFSVEIIDGSFIKKLAQDNLKIQM